MPTYNPMRQLLNKTKIVYPVIASLRARQSRTRSTAYPLHASILVLLLLPGIAFAQAAPTTGNADVNALYALVGQWYLGFLMPVGSILAGIVILIAGILYITSGGDTAKTGKAKELIFGALTGLVVLVCAALIIRTLIT